MRNVIPGVQVAMEPAFEMPTRASLIVRLRSSADDGAWQQFFQSYQPMIRVWAQRKGLAPVDADDVIQLVLMSLMRSLGNFAYDPERGFRGWLKRVVHNEICNHFRARQRRPGDWAAGDSVAFQQIMEAPDAVDDLVNSMNEPLERKQRHLELALARVKERKGESSNAWQSFWQTCILDLPTVKVAEALQMSFSAVNQAAYRVRQDVRAEIQELETHEP